MSTKFKIAGSDEVRSFNWPSMAALNFELEFEAFFENYEEGKKNTYILSQDEFTQWQKLNDECNFTNIYKEAILNSEIISRKSLDKIVSDAALKSDLENIGVNTLAAITEVLNTGEQL